MLVLCVTKFKLHSIRGCNNLMSRSFCKFVKVYPQIGWRTKWWKEPSCLWHCYLCYDIASPALLMTYYFLIIKKLQSLFHAYSNWRVLQKTLKLRKVLLYACFQEMVIIMSCKLIILFNLCQSFCLDSFESFITSLLLRMWKNESWYEWWMYNWAGPRL